MDKNFYPLFITQVILKWHPPAQKETVQDETGWKTKGLLVNAGPVCLCKNIVHIKFCEDLFEEGVHNSLGLPNGTEATQELEQ